MSTSLFEFMYFGYGRPIIRFVGVGVRISSGDLASRHPRVRVAGGDLAEPGPQLADVRAGARRRVSPGGGAQRRLEHRVHLHRHARCPRSGSAGWLIASSSPIIRGGSSRRAPVGQSSVDLGLAGPHPGAPRLAAGEDGQSRSPAWISRGRGVDERSAGCCRPAVVYAGLGRRDAEPLGDEAGRVAVAPRQQADDADRVGRGSADEPGVGRRARAPPAPSADRFEGVVERRRRAAGTGRRRR